MKKIDIKGIISYERYSNGFFRLSGKTTDANGQTRKIYITGKNGPQLPKYKIDGKEEYSFRTYNGAKAQNHLISEDRESIRIYTESETIKVNDDGEITIQNPLAVQILPPYSVNECPQRIGKTTGKPTKPSEKEYALVQRAQLNFIFSYCKCDGAAALADRLYKKATKGDHIGVDPIIDEKGKPIYDRPWYQLILENLPEIMDESRENPLNTDLVKYGAREWSAWEDSWMRAVLWTNYILERPKSQDSYLPLGELLTELQKRLVYFDKSAPDNDTLINQLKNAESAHKRFTIVPDKEGAYICLRKVKKAEEEAASLLSYFPKAKPEQAEIIESMELSEEQREAVQGITSIYQNGGGIAILTGGPGTGKTTVLRSVLDTLEGYGEENVLLTSPTGMAAKRMSDATGRKASTIHRALEVDPEKGLEHFKRNEENPFTERVFIVDEVSMIDIVLLRDFLLAVPKGATIVLVGDPDQLPSVGPGQVLKELLDTNDKIAKYKLTRNYRSGESVIAENAEKIIKGEADLTYKDGEFERYECSGNNPLPLIRTTAKREGIDIMSDDCQILTYKNSDAFLINRQITEAEVERLYRKHHVPQLTPVMSYDGRQYFSGEKVILTRNNYGHKNSPTLREAKKEIGEDVPYFNGEKGRIIAVDYSECKVTVELPDKELILYGEDLKDLSPAYAITTHKSQGSEYKSVIIYANDFYCPADRQWLYTATTRSKERVIYIDKGNAIETYIKTPAKPRKSHFLREMTMHRLTGSSETGKIEELLDFFSPRFREEIMAPRLKELHKTGLPYEKEGFPDFIQSVIRYLKMTTRKFRQEIIRREPKIDAMVIFHRDFIKRIGPTISPMFSNYAMKMIYNYDRLNSLNPPKPVMRQEPYDPEDLPWEYDPK